MFGTRNELEMGLKNTSTQLLAKILLDIWGKIKIIAHTQLEISYYFMMALLTHIDA